MYVQTGTNGRILVTVSNDEYTDETYIMFEFPADFDYAKQNEYRIANGELVHDPLPPSEQQLQAEREQLKKQQLETATLMMVRSSAPTMTDAQALELSELFEDWQAGEDYAAGVIVRYDGNLYRVAQAHTSQADWLPDATAALYTPVSFSGGYEEWKQPTGAHDAYNIGDKVTHNGSIYESLINGNTTVPGSDPRWWKEI